MDKIFRKNKEEILIGLKATKQGLSSEEVTSRIEQFGENRIAKSKKKNYLKQYLKSYTEFFAMLLEVAAALSFVSDKLDPGQGYNVLGWAIVCAVVINSTFTFWQEYKADKAMEALLRLMPSLIKVIRSGVETEVDSKEIVPGDIIVLEEGDKLPADAALIESHSLYVNMSTLNGESQPVLRTSESSKADSHLEAENLVFAGTTVTRGSGKAVVYATADATEFGKIATLTRDVKRVLTPMQKEIMRITRIMAVIAMFMGVIFFLLGWFSDRSVLVSAIFALSLIVANVPEGLLPTITLSLSIASQRMAKKNALVKNLDSVETLGSATVICTDKTGTITRNQMTLKRAWIPGGVEVNFEGEGYFETGKVEIKNNNPKHKEIIQRLFTYGKVNCRAVIEQDEAIGDPTELAIVKASEKVGINLEPIQYQDEIPFTSERMMMSTLVKEDDETRIYSKGALEVILSKCSSYLNEDGKIFELTESIIESIQSQANQYQDEAYRVLSFAYGSDSNEENLVFQGIVAIMDLPRPEIKGAVEKCYTAGVRIMMITGDNPRTAVAVAKKIGLKVDRVLTGKELRLKSDGEMREILKKEDILFARMESSQKLRITSILQDNAEVVAMTGDGVNDAPALRKADIGIAMGKTGTEVTKEAADIVLLDDNFNSIVSAIEEGRTVFFNIKKFVTYIMSSNVPEIVPYILYFFMAIPLPLSVIQILSIDLGSDIVPGLALGTEKPEPNIMKRPPVGKKERIMDWETFKRGYFMNGVFEAAASMFAFLMFLFLHDWNYGDLSIENTLLHKQAMTMTLLGAVSCQLLNVWTLRSFDFSAFSMPLKRNKMLLWAMVAEIIWVLLMLYVPAVQNIFNTASIPFEDLWLLLPFPIMLFVNHEWYKYRRRKKGLHIVH